MPVPTPDLATSTLPPDIGLPTADEPADSPAMPPAIVPSAQAQWPLRLPIPLHLPLYIITTMAGFLGGAFLGATRGPSLLPHGFPMPIVFFGGAILGLVVSKLIFALLILGLCPKCGGAARIKTGRPITYRCLACGHVRTTSVSGG
ncbi:MAG: transposase [Armatimonadetes bacterium]|nr:transposase [Armatimonadota bacterium]